MDDGSIIVFWLLIGAVVGGIIGASRNNAGSGVVWGALLGPIGWIVVLFLDERPKCPECRGPIPENAHRCRHCGHDFYARTNSRSVPPHEETNTGKKKCPFCAELIQLEAIKCRYCGSDLSKIPSMAEQIAEKLQSAELKPEANRLNLGMAAFPEGSRIPCPLCGQRIVISTLKQGENFCPHCFEKFVAE